MEHRAPPYAVVAVVHVRYNGPRWNEMQSLLPIAVRNDSRLKPMSWRCGRCRVVAAAEGDSIDLDWIYKRKAAAVCSNNNNGIARKHTYPTLSV